MSDAERNEITVERLGPENEQLWEQVVTGSPNGHLMARCGYFRYHADRFEDHSLLFRKGNRPMAVLPANRVGEILWSHQGVSFGGLIMARRCRFGDVKDIFSALTDRMREDALTKLLYRPAPHPYQRAPREDDLYCLARGGARIVDTKLHAMVRCGGFDASNQKWRQDVKRATAAGVRVVPATEIENLWPHVVALLHERHGQKPVHSLEEVHLLASRFRKEIRILEARSAQGEFLAGLLFMVSENTINGMYLGETPEGRASEAGRVILNHFMEAHEFDGFWLDMGQWTDTDTREESESLLHFKESAGARLIQRHTWELEVG